MNEFEAILEIIRKSKHYLVHGVMTAVLTCFAGWYYVSQIPDEYTSSSTIYVNPKSILDSLLSGITVNSDNVDQEFIAFAYSQITSRENIRRLVRRIDKDINATNQAEMTELTNQVRANLVLNLQINKSSRYLTIGYSADTPDNARDVVSEASNVFMEAAIGSSSADSTESVEFIEKQITEYEQKLHDSEDELEIFKRVNFGLLPGDGSNYFGRLQKTSDAIRDADLALKEAEQRAAQIRLAMENSSNNAVDAKLTLQRIAKLQARLDELQLRYTESHPDVYSTKQQLKILRAQYEGAGIVANDITLANQALGLTNANADTAVLRTRLEEYKRRKAELTAAVETIPNIEKQLRRLMRNYNLFRNQRDALVQRREQALVAQEAGLRSANPKFRIIEPPGLPAAPSNTPEYILQSGVLLASIALGFGVALILALLRPVFSSIAEMGRTINAPIIGGVSEVSLGNTFPYMKVVLVSLSGALVVSVYLYIAVWPFVVILFS